MYIGTYPGYHLLLARRQQETESEDKDNYRGDLGYEFCPHPENSDCFFCLSRRTRHVT